MIGGRIAAESVVGLRRNQRPTSVGMRSKHGVLDLVYAHELEITFSGTASDTRPRAAQPFPTGFPLFSAVLPG